MIGKIYRPVKVLSLAGKRGYRFYHKYISCFTGQYHFQKDVYLHFQDGGESIRIEIRDLNIPVLLNGNQFVLKDNHWAVTKQEKRKVVLENVNLSSLRKICRPANKQISSKKNMLTIKMPILSAEDSETLVIQMKPIVLNNEEYLWFFASADTQIELMANSSVIASSGEGSNK